MPPLVSSQFLPHFLRQIQSFRNDHFLCDCRLVVAIRQHSLDADSDQQPATLEFPAHRLVLASSSPFFRNLFKLKHQESMTTVNLNNCSPECLEVILQFLYSGELQLGILDPQQVLLVAKYLQIKSLEQILSPLTSQKEPQDPPSPGQKRKLGNGFQGSVEQGLKRSSRSPSTPKQPCPKQAVLSCGACVSASRRSSVDSDSCSLASIPYEPSSDPGLPVPSNKPSPPGAFSPPSVSLSGAVQPRPNYFGPLVPTEQMMANGQFMPASISGIFPQLFPKSPLMLNGSPLPLIPSSASNDLYSSPSSTKSLRSQGVNAVLNDKSSSPESQMTPKAATENSGLIMVPSNDKEGWCRNKKYIQKVPNGYQCTVCSKVYGRYNSVSYHVTIYHRNPPIKCDEPGCQFTTREARYIHFHKYYRHSIPLPKSIDLGSRSCPFCRHVAKSPAMLDKHVSRHIPDCVRVGKHFKCSDCGLQLQTQRAIAEHMREHAEEKSYQCQQCSYKGRTEGNLQQHTLFKHSSEMFKKPFTCDDCGYCCPTQQNLSAHKRREHQTDKEGGGELFIDDEEFDLDFQDEENGEGLLKIAEESDEPLNLSRRGSDVPAPPPSLASTEGLGKAVSETENRDADDVSTDLDDSHSQLASAATTGYHSMVNYGNF